LNLFFFKDRPKSIVIEDEIARVKFECRQQIIDGEIESYKLRLNQSNHEKDELLKIIKELEKKYKELQIKYDADEHLWTRIKKDMSEKQRKVNHYLFLFFYL
jgi:predicted  nucleic acid-binding Zn-ribbon protein